MGEFSLYLTDNHIISQINKNYTIRFIQSIITRFPLVKDLFIVIISVILLIIGSSFIFDSANKWVYWLYDDTEHLSAAYNLFHGKGLTVDSIDIEVRFLNTNIPALQSHDQISHPLRAKGPLHLVLLGGWLSATGANFGNWYFWGSLFNLILTAAFIVIFYLFTKRFFGIAIGAYATPVLAVTPAVLWVSVRIRPDVLSYLFMLVSLYFGKGNNTSKCSPRGYVRWDGSLSSSNRDSSRFSNSCLHVA